MRLTRDVGDILDRFSISILKDARISTRTTHKEFKQYERGFEDLLLEFANDHTTLNNTLRRLTDLNTIIWDLESAVRQGQLDDDVEEVGRRAIAIRQTNALRIATCNEVNIYFQEGTENVKKYHVSASAGSKDSPDQT